MRNKSFEGQSVFFELKNCGNEQMQARGKQIAFAGRNNVYIDSPIAYNCIKLPISNTVNFSHAGQGGGVRFVRLETLTK